MTSFFLSKIASHIGLLPDGTKPIPEPVLTYQWGHYHEKILRYQSVKLDSKLQF